MKVRLKNCLRVLRLTCAITLIAVSLWALLLPPLFPYSTHAIVNTKVVTIKARDQGQVGQLPAAGATALKAGERIATVTRDLAKIKRQIDERQFTRLKLKEQLDSLDAVIETRQRKLQEAAAEATAERLSARQVLEQTYAATVDRVRVCTESLAEKTASQRRVEPLFKDGIVTSAQWSETRQETIRAEQNLAAAKTDLAQLAAKLEGLRRGAGERIVEAGDAAPGAGAYERDIGSLRLQRIELAAELGEVERQIASGKSYQEVDRSYDLTTPIDGIIWRRSVVNGENVMDGQTIAEVADAHAMFIEAYFRRDFLNSVAVGDRASIYLIGDARFIEGRVVDIQIQERTAKDPSIINTSSVDTSMLRVTIEVKEGALKAGNIGQLAKVLTSSGKAGWLERGMVWLSLMLRSNK